MSSGSPSRPIGWVAPSFCSRNSLNCSASSAGTPNVRAMMGVRMTPGAMAFERMPCTPSSAAAWRTTPTTACLAIVYPGALQLPCRAAALAVLTIEPGVPWAMN